MGIMYTKDIKKENYWKRKIAAVAAVFMMLCLVFTATGCGNNSVEEDVEIEQQELDKETVNYGNDGVNGAIAPDEASPEEVAMVSQQNAEMENQTMVSMSVEGTGRADPFLPPYGSGGTTAVASLSRAPRIANYDLLPPPENITVDTTATEVMTTKVSGIMFDKFNPSAILNISGADYLVRTGDVVNNYKVLSIAQDTVTVQYGANVYKAGVGELFTGEGINYNTISNLQNKFGGNKNK